MSRGDRSGWAVGLRLGLVLRGLAAGMVVFACSGVSPSLAAPAPWVTPVKVSGAGEVEGLQTAVGADGTVAVTWVRDQTDVQVSVRPPGGVFIAPVTLAETEEADPQVAVGPDGTTTVAWNARDDDDEDSNILVSTRPPAGSFDTPTLVSSRGQEASDPQIAVAPDGSITVVWIAIPRKTFVAQARTRPPGGTFGPSVTFSAGTRDVDDLRVAVGGDGATTVAWSEKRGLFARGGIARASTRPPGGSFAAPATLSTNGANASGLEVAAGPDGTTTVVWSAAKTGGTNAVQASTRPPGGVFGAPVTVFDGGRRVEELDVAAGRDGTTAVTWETPEFRNFRSGSGGVATVGAFNTAVQVSIRPPAGSFGAPTTLSIKGTDSSNPRVVIADDGTVTMVWEAYNFVGVIVQASSRPQGGLFRAPVNVSREGQAGALPEVVMTPNGLTTVVWRRVVAGRSGVRSVAFTLAALAAAPAAPVPPSPEGRAKLTGMPVVGRTLRCTSAPFANATKRETGWFRGSINGPDGIAIRGASKSTYRLTAKDRGEAIRCFNLATGPGGRGFSVSRALRVGR